MSGSDPTAHDSRRRRSAGTPAFVPRRVSLHAPLFRIERVTDSVYAAIAAPAAMLNCNAAVIVGRDHVLVVDTHSRPSAARALVEQIKAEITDKPVRYVFNSHFHWDHTHGNAAYPNACGDAIDIISSATTRDWIAREGIPRLRHSINSIRNEINSLRARLAAGETSAERESLALRVAELESYLSEMSPGELALPTITFDQRLVVWSGEREIHLMFLGRGHTAGDIVVHVPEERVIATGDLLHGILPYIGDGYPDEWPRTLGRLEELDFDYVVPGHGSVQQGKSVLSFYRGYLEEINDAVARGIERGATLTELQKMLRPESLGSLRSGEQGTRVEREIVSVFGRAWVSDSPLNDGVASNVAEIHNFYLRRRASD